MMKRSVTSIIIVKIIIITQIFCLFVLITLNTKLYQLINKSTSNMFIKQKQIMKFFPLDDINEISNVDITIVTIIEIYLSVI